MTVSCSRFRELAPDLALDLLTGLERADVLAHLEACRPCRIEMASLLECTEQILSAAPPAEPPMGFEQRVLARLAEETRAAPRRHPRRRRVALLAAAALFAAVVSAVAMLELRGTSDPASAATDMRTGTGELVGHATLRDDDRTTVVVDIPAWSELARRYGDDAADTYWLAVNLTDGTRRLVPLPTRTGQPWEVAINSDPDDVTAVGIVDVQGRTWCSAEFT